MPRFFVKQNQIKQDIITIEGKDINHIKNVLRKQVGDIIEICNQEDGEAYKCKIINLGEDRIETNIIKRINSKENSLKIDIYQGIPKSDKMELIIQKSTELGANAIIPVSMKRCVAKIEPKDESKKIARWQKIAEIAAKQSGRNTIPEVRNVVTIADIIKLRKQYDSIIVAYEDEKENTIKKELLRLKILFLGKGQINVAVVIGPEGGLELEDVEKLKQQGAEIITLGDRILRTETVALNVLSIIMYELEN